MITSQKNRRGYYLNEITDCLDKYLKKCDGCTDFYSNYIYPDPIDNYWLIRIPGMTVGRIKVINGIVTEATVYKDNISCYEEGVLNSLQQFVNKKIDLL